jgi:rubrerythrin
MKRPHKTPQRATRKSQTRPSPALLIWQCPNCGQSYFGEYPPDMCDYCQDFTTWRQIELPDSDNKS